MTPEGVEKHWELLQGGVMEIASKAFLCPRQQRKPWVGERTLELVEQKKAKQEELCKHYRFGQKMARNWFAESTQSVLQDWFHQWRLIWRIRKLAKLTTMQFKSDRAYYDLNLFESMRRAEENDDAKELNKNIT